MLITKTTRCLFNVERISGQRLPTDNKSSVLTVVPRAAAASRASGIILRTLLSLACVTLLASSAFASDPYDKVVKHLEKEYNAHKQHIPFMGLANLVLKFWQPAGVKHVKVSYFNDDTLYSKTAGTKFDAVVEKAAGGEWHPILREFSRTRGEWTYVYCDESGKDTKAMVVTINRTNAVVAEVKFNEGKLIEFVQNPEWGRSLARDLNRDSQPSDPVPTGAAFASGSPVSLSSDSAWPGARTREKPRLVAASKADSFGYTAFPSSDDGAGTNQPIKLEARLVNLNAVALDANGRAMSELSKSDFTIYEDGVKQDIVFFDTGDSPVNLLILLDLSGSTSSKINLMKEAALRFIDSLPPGDKIAVAAFTRKFYLISDFTSDRKTIDERIRHMKNLRGGTAYYDAMWTALDGLDYAGASRKALVAITDGVDDLLTDPKSATARHPFSQLAERASEDDVTIYPIYLDTERELVKMEGNRGHEASAVGRQQLDSLASQTGGKLVRTDVSSDLDRAYAEVAAELHTLYSIAYAPKDLKSDGRWRKLEVKVGDPAVTIRAKRGFYDNHKLTPTTLSYPQGREEGLAPADFCELFR